jgi:hypothetical protein
MKRIGFYLPHLDLQGTGVSLYDYAFFNQTLLGNKSVMFYDEEHPSTHPLVKEKFQKAMETISVPGRENMPALASLCNESKIDALYFSKCGRQHDGRYIDNIPTFIHANGAQHEPHGTVYAYVSKWLSDHCSGGTIPYVSHIINLPSIDQDLRSKFNIPQNGIVFGRTGGTYSWNIPFVNDVIREIVNIKNNYYFLFVNTTPFIQHERVLFIEPFSDLLLKRKFINTCNAMIHARQEGESFGIAVGEFSFCNKPVITYIQSPEKNHIVTLGDKGLYYSDYNSLKNIFLDPSLFFNRDFNAYKNYVPEKVMYYFNEVFLNKL